MSQLNGPLPSSAASLAAGHVTRALTKSADSSDRFKRVLAAKRRDDVVTISSVEIEDAVRPLADPSQEEAHQEHRQHENPAKQPSEPRANGLDLEA